MADCTRCPRLVRLRAEIRASFPDYHAAPVAAWGSPRARLLIVGLAPGKHGANRTGRPFTGDASGEFLFRALSRAGFASAAEADQARLIGARITNAVKCLPPANRPVAAEVAACRPYLAAELETLFGRRRRRPRCVLCLGRLAHDAVARALADRQPPFARVPAFRHGQQVQLGEGAWLMDTYHPSRQNTNTGRLTDAMLDEVLASVGRIIDLA